MSSQSVSGTVQVQRKINIVLETAETKNSILFVIITIHILAAD